MKRNVPSHIFHGSDQHRCSYCHWSKIYENAAVGISLIDLNGRWLHVNQRFCEMLGYSEEELIGRAVADVTHPQDNNIDWQKYPLLASGQIESYNVEKRYVCKDGSDLWTLVTRSLDRDEAGNPLHVLSIVQDITRRQMAEEQLRQVAQFPEENPDVEVAGDMATALEMADRYSYDLLVSDLGLPDGSGHDLIQELRMRGHKFPGIALSGYGQEEDIQRSYEAGFTAHLTKPASREAVFAAVAAAITGNGNPTPDFFITYPHQTDAPVFDADQALNRCFGKHETLLELMEFFPKESSELLRQMHVALGKVDFAEVRRTTHRLKGSLFYLGAQPAVDAAAKVEQAAKSGDLTAASGAVTELKKQVELLKNTLASCTAKPDLG